jgi:hypothetical protein
MKMEQCSETSTYKIQTPGNYPEENIQYVSRVFVFIGNINIRQLYKLPLSAQA